MGRARLERRLGQRRTLWEQGERRRSETCARRSIACRPSDAIAVALRSPGTVLQAPERVMAEGGTLPNGWPAPDYVEPVEPRDAGGDGGTDSSGEESISFT